MQRRLREGWQRIPHSRSCGVLAWLTARSNSVQPDPMKQEQPWQGARPKKKRGYNNPAHPHAPSEIMEMGKPKARTYQYDGNGNPIYYEESKSFRSMVWDEENRLRGINDNGKLHLYTYDHTGERAVKSSGESSTVVTNGLTSAVITHMDDYTAYVNPYFVVQKGKFTKHYFEGSARIVSKLGEGTFVHKNTGIMAGGIDYIRQNAQMQEARDNYIRGLKVPPGPPTQHGIYASPEWTGQPYPSLGWQNIRQDQEPPEGWPRPPKFNEPGDVPGPPVQYGDPITPQTVKAGYGFVPNGIREKNLYFYPPDPLGSSSYITDREGRITQHTEYIAFGEVLFEEHSTSKTMPYLFNGKELDTETGLYYYGARYYDSKVSLWLNVDPLAEKTMTPYAYTNNNPIMLVDPDGRESTSTGVRQNDDGSYTVVNAKNDGDNGIYIADKNGNYDINKSKKIGTTNNYFDFLLTYDSTGKFGGVAKNNDGSNIVLNNNNLNLATLLYKYSYNTNNGIQNYYLDLINLAVSSKNGGSLDLKVSLGIDKYAPIRAGENYTTLRAASNILFGFNMRRIYEKYKNNTKFKSEFKTAEDFYRYTMQVVGGYNQYQNNRGNFIDNKGYNKGFPFYGEHAYSGVNIYRGYFKQFTNKKLHK